MENQKENQMYEVVKSKVVTTKWIVTEKEEGRSCKVRLVARGFEDVEMEAKHAPKFSGGSLKMVSVVIGKCGWKCCNIVFGYFCMCNNMELLSF